MPPKKKGRKKLSETPCCGVAAVWWVLRYLGMLPVYGQTREDFLVWAKHHILPPNSQGGCTDEHIVEMLLCHGVEITPKRHLLDKTHAPTVANLSKRFNSALWNRKSENHDSGQPRVLLLCTAVHAMAVVTNQTQKQIWFHDQRNNRYQPAKVQNPKALIRFLIEIKPKQTTGSLEPPKPIVPDAKTENTHSRRPVPQRQDQMMPQECNPATPDHPSTNPAPMECAPGSDGAHNAKRELVF